MKHFKFGENWKNFSKLIDNNRLKEAVISLKKLTNKKSLNDLSFLDIGCGSGLSSLAAIQLNCKKSMLLTKMNNPLKQQKKFYKNQDSKKLKLKKKIFLRLMKKKNLT